MHKVLAWCMRNGTNAQSIPSLFFNNWNRTKNEMQLLQLDSYSNPAAAGCCCQKQQWLISSSCHGFWYTAKTYGLCHWLWALLYFKLNAVVVLASFPFQTTLKFAGALTVSWKCLRTTSTTGFIIKYPRISPTECAVLIVKSLFITVKQRKRKFHEICSNTDRKPMSCHN